MSGRGTLKVRVDKFLDGQLIGNAVPVRIRSSVGNGRNAGLKSLTVVSAPAGGYHTKAWATVELAAGSYDLEAVLPSGEVLTDQVEVEADEVAHVELRGEHSRNEWRSWAHFSGSRDASPTALESADLLKSVRTFDFADYGPDYKVTAGTRALGASLDFHPASWDAWADYLERRWELRGERSDYVDDFHLDPTGAIQLQTYSGQAGEPTRIEASASGSRAVAPADVGRIRQFIAVTSAKGTRVVSVPWPWLTLTQTTKPFFELLVSETRDELLCEPVIRDEHLGGLLAYLTAGRVAIAGELLSTAHDALFEKYQNPLGAAAGGYVLLSTDASENLHDWPYWLSNLANNFPSLPDGAILRAKWLLDRGKTKDLPEAADCLTRAYERGIPFFTAGVVWLIDGLRRIEEPTRLSSVLTVARSMDLSRGITSFHLAAPDQRGGGRRVRYEHSPMQAVGVSG